MQNNSTDPLFKLRFPIGKFSLPGEITETQLEQWIKTLADFPEKIKSLVNGLSSEQLDTRYRPDGWTIRQVVHHLADSHVHSYIRFKWALTEDKPVIKYYFEDRWAELEDARYGPIEPSLMQLKATHSKLVSVLEAMTADDFNREFIHPEYNKAFSLKVNTGIYAWHCDHHYSHIENCLRANNWM